MPKKMQFMIPKAKHAFSMAQVLLVSMWNPLMLKLELPTPMLKNGLELDRMVKRGKWVCLVFKR